MFVRVVSSINVMFYHFYVCSPATLLAGELIGPPVVMVMRERTKAVILDHVIS